MGLCCLVKHHHFLVTEDQSALLKNANLCFKPSSNLWKSWFKFQSSWFFGVVWKSGTVCTPPSSRLSWYSVCLSMSGYEPTNNINLSPSIFINQPHKNENCDSAPESLHFYQPHKNENCWQCNSAKTPKKHSKKLGCTRLSIRCLAPVGCRAVRGGTSCTPSGYGK